MMRVKVKKKNYFNLGNLKIKKAKVYLKRSYTNIFITLADLEGRVILCRTSGSSGISGSKRKKRAPQAIEMIVQNLLPVLKLYKIKSVEIILRSRISSYFHYLVKELNYYGIKILGFTIRRKVAHNGVRGRKQRRV